MMHPAQYHSSRILRLLERNTNTPKLTNRFEPDQGNLVILKVDDVIFNAVVSDTRATKTFRKTEIVKRFVRKNQISPMFAVAYAENFYEGGLIQWHREVICIWCALIVTSQFDVIALFPIQRFGEVC